MGDLTKIALGGFAALVLLGQCGGNGVAGKAKAAAGGAAVGAAAGGAVGVGVGAGGAGALAGLKGAAGKRVEHALTPKPTTTTTATQPKKPDGKKKPDDGKADTVMTTPTTTHTSQPQMVPCPQVGPNGQLVMGMCLR